MGNQSLRTHYPAQATYTDHQIPPWWEISIYQDNYPARTVLTNDEHCICLGLVSSYPECRVFLLLRQIGHRWWPSWWLWRVAGPRLFASFSWYLWRCRPANRTCTSVSRVCGRSKSVNVILLQKLDWQWWSDGFTLSYSLPSLSYSLPSLLYLKDHDAPHEFVRWFVSETFFRIGEWQIDSFEVRIVDSRGCCCVAAFFH